MSRTGPQAADDLGDRIVEAARARRALILHGPNTNDLVLGPRGFVYLRELIELRHAAEGRVPVVCSTLGVVQDPVPEQRPAPLRLPPSDTPPGQSVRDVVDQLRTCTTPCVVIVDFADLLLPAQFGGQLSADQQLLVEALATFPIDPDLGSHRLVVISRADGLDQRLARFPGWEVIVVDLPAEALRRAMAARLEERRTADPASVGPLEPGLTADRFARDCGGLTLDDMMRGASGAAERGEPITRRWVHDTKVARLRQRGAEGLEVYPRGRGLRHVAGLPQVRLFLEERRRTGSYPRSIVLAGPPGVGKTLVVRAIGDENGFPVVALRNVRSMWQGETERIVEGVLRTCRVMAPLVVHVDEVDQSLGQRETGPSVDGGTGGRILAAMWEFLGDANHDLPVVFVMTTNRPDLLDNATRSRSEVIPILHPTPLEQVDVLRIACRAEGWRVEASAVEATVEGLGGQLVSGRMLVRLAQRAAVVAATDGAGELTGRHLGTAAAELLEEVDPVDDERMALKALALASFTTYLPWVAARRLGERVELLPYVVPLLDDAGVLDRARLRRRIAELDQAAAERLSARMA